MFFRHAGALIFSFTVLLSGCATGPQYEEPGALESHAVLRVIERDADKGTYLAWISEIQGLPSSCRKECRVYPGEVTIFVESRPPSSKSFWDLRHEVVISYATLNFTAIKGETYYISAEKGSLVGHVAFNVKDSKGSVLATIEEHKHTKQLRPTYVPIIIPAR